MESTIEMDDEKLMISSFDRAKMALHFPPGIVMSVIWGGCTHSDNYDNIEIVNPEHKHGICIASTTVEIMFCGKCKPPKSMVDAIMEEDVDLDYPLGYVPIEKMLKLIDMCRSLKDDDRVEVSE